MAINNPAALVQEISKSSKKFRARLVNNCVYISRLGVTRNRALPCPELVVFECFASLPPRGAYNSNWHSHLIPSKHYNYSVRQPFVFPDYCIKRKPIVYRAAWCLCNRASSSHSNQPLRHSLENRVVKEKKDVYTFISVFENRPWSVPVEETRRTKPVTLEISSPIEVHGYVAWNMMHLIGTVSTS